MEIITSKFKAGKHIDLHSFGTLPDNDADKATGLDMLSTLKEEMFELQEKLYADNQKAVLILFQAMDAAGKDSAIKHVMGGLNPQGCQVFSFKQPTSEELDHDFLWRHYKALPERGRLGIHNRSHYENVLVCKVHPAFAANESQVKLEDINNDFWDKRYHSIRNFEEHLCNTGTVVLKFFLHISKDEQKKRFLERIDDPSKNWKFSAGDLTERDLWDNYMDAYQDAFKHTSTEKCPWYIIPADKKWFARVAICKVIVDTLNEMKLKYPVLSQTDINSLADSKAKLLGED